MTNKKDIKIGLKAPSEYSYSDVELFFEDFLGTFNQYDTYSIGMGIHASWVCLDVFHDKLIDLYSYREGLLDIYKKSGYNALKGYVKTCFWKEYTKIQKKYQKEEVYAKEQYGNYVCHSGFYKRFPCLIEELGAIFAKALTNREKEVFLKHIQGLSVLQIAGELNIAIVTVRKHIRKGREKLEEWRNAIIHTINGTSWDVPWDAAIRI